MPNRATSWKNDTNEICLVMFYIKHGRYCCHGCDTFDYYVESGISFIRVSNVDFQ